MKRARREDGFSLVEAIAALAVTAIIAAGLMAALGSASARSAEAHVRSGALRVAQALLEEGMAANDPRALPSKGVTTGDGLAWSRTISPASAPYNGLLRVEVEILWRSANKKGATRLEAYRIAPA